MWLLGRLAGLPGIRHALSPLSRGLSRLAARYVTDPLACAAHTLARQRSGPDPAAELRDWCAATGGGGGGAHLTRWRPAVAAAPVVATRTSPRRAARLSPAPATATTQAAAAAGGASSTQPAPTASVSVWDLSGLAHSLTAADAAAVDDVVASVIHAVTGGGGVAGGRGSPLQRSGGARDNTTLGSSALAQLARSARGRSTPLRPAAQLPAPPPGASGSRGRRSSVPPVPTASSDAVGSALVAGFAGLGALPPAPLAQAAGVNDAVPTRRGGFGGAFSPAPARAAAAKAPAAPFPAFNAGAPAPAPLTFNFGGPTAAPPASKPASISFGFAPLPPPAPAAALGLDDSLPAFPSLLPPAPKPPAAPAPVALPTFSFGGGGAPAAPFPAFNFGPPAPVPPPPPPATPAAPPLHHREDSDLAAALGVGERSGGPAKLPPPPKTAPRTVRFARLADSPPPPSAVASAAAAPAGNAGAGLRITGVDAPADAAPRTPASVGHGGSSNVQRLTSLAMGASGGTPSSQRRLGAGASLTLHELADDDEPAAATSTLGAILLAALAVCLTLWRGLVVVCTACASDLGEALLLAPAARTLRLLLLPPPQHAGAVLALPATRDEVVDGTVARPVGALVPAVASTSLSLSSLSHSLARLAATLATRWTYRSPAAATAALLGDVRATVGCLDLLVSAMAASRHEDRHGVVAPTLPTVLACLGSLLAALALYVASPRHRCGQTGPRTWLPEGAWGDGGADGGVGGAGTCMQLGDPLTPVLHPGASGATMRVGGGVAGPLLAGGAGTTGVFAPLATRPAEAALLLAGVRGVRLLQRAFPGAFDEAVDRLPSPLQAAAIRAALAGAQL